MNQNQFTPEIPFNDLPRLMPKSVYLQDRDILLISFEISEVMQDIKGKLESSGGSLQGSLALYAPLFVPEAVSSSEIENITTNNKEIFEAKFLDRHKLTLAKKETMNYVEALQEGASRLIEKGYLNTNDYIDIQKVLEPNRPGLRNLPGAQIYNPSTKTVHYTPPEGERTIRELLANFEHIFNDSSPAHEVYSRMAILHYQFEAIHPFRDGNGRTGRMLMPLYLMAQQKLPLPVLFISHYILKHRDEYYKKLRAVTEKGEWKEWILYILEATKEQAEHTRDVVQKIQQVSKKIDKKIEKKLPEVYSPEIVSFLFANAYFTQKHFEKVLGISPMTARKYLQFLEGAGVTRKKRQIGRNRFIFSNPDYTKILQNV